MKHDVFVIFSDRFNFYPSAFILYPFRERDMEIMSLFPVQRTTPLPGGYMGKILRADLSTGTLRDENLPEEPILRKFIGGQALASYILLKELPLNATPFGPENIVVMMTGPLTGNGFTPGGTKMTAVYLSPLTHTTLGRGATSGYWATYLKAAGYDGIILTGASPRPVYLYIDEGKAELRDAANFWGLGTRATEDRLREAVGHREAKVLCIGPAGENMNRAAMLANDYNHFAAHSGGAVLGSKKLKAIVVHGTKRPSFRDKTKLVDAGWRWRQTLQQHDVKKKKTKYGHGEAWGALNNLNWRSTDLSPAHIHGFDQNDVVLRPCFQCARLCPWDARLGEGEFKGTRRPLQRRRRVARHFFQSRHQGQFRALSCRARSTMSVSNAATSHAAPALRSRHGKKAFSVRIKPTV